MRQIIIQAENLREDDVAEILGTSYKITQVLPGYPVDIRFKADVPYPDAPNVETGSLYLDPHSAVQVWRDI